MAVMPDQLDRDGRDGLHQIAISPTLEQILHPLNMGEHRGHDDFWHRRLAVQLTDSREKGVAILSAHQYVEKNDIWL